MTFAARAVVLDCLVPSARHSPWFTETLRSAPQVCAGSDLDRVKRKIGTPDNEALTVERNGDVPRRAGSRPPEVACVHGNTIPV